jgi:nucleoside-diphosphate-sugar epimerase
VTKAKKVLVAGASGLVGKAAIRHFSALGWDVVGLSRRSPAGLENVKLISADLIDAAASGRAVSSLGDVTHVVYAAVQEEPGLFAGWIDETAIERNGAMLRNLFEPLLAAAHNLEHVSLLHGTKAYGIHHPAIGPRGVKNPLREREPRAEHPNFYFLQEDYLLEKQQGASWGLTIFRPTVIYGEAWGNNLNPMPVIAAYAALQRARGEPLHFPGRAGYPVLREAVDVDLVAGALGWAATRTAARGGTYNLTNGDVFLWENAWPAIAEEFGMEAGEPRPLSLTEDLPRRREEWAALVQAHRLEAPSDIVEFTGANSLIYTDMLLAGAANPGTPVLNSTIAARQAGFTDCIDTEDMFRKWTRRFHELRLVPPRP